MNRAKPIEKGCKAIVLSGFGGGKFVDVGVFFGKHPRFPVSGNDWWAAYPDGWEAPDTVDRACQERNMMRVDDDEIQSQIESESSIPVIVR